MKRLRFKSLLLIGFSILLLLSITIGLWGLFQINKISSNTTILYNSPLVVSNAVRDININIYEMQNSLKDIVLSNSEEEINTSLASIEKNDKIIHQSFDTISQRFLGDKGIILDALNEHNKWNTILNEVIALKLNGKDKEAANIEII